MITVVVFLGCVILGIVLNTVINACAVARYRSGKKISNFRFGILAVIALIIIACALPAPIAKSAGYNSFNSYLLWAEGCLPNGALGVSAYYETEDGYAYSQAGYTLSGFAVKEGGRIKRAEIDYLKAESVKNDNDEQLQLTIYKVRARNLLIIVSHLRNGGEYLLTINGEEAAPYKVSSGMLSKINVIENADALNLVFNGWSTTI